MIRVSEGNESACQEAVQRAYDGLCTDGLPERFAFEAALEVYRWHHPHAAPTEAEVLVSSWLWDGASH